MERIHLATLFHLLACLSLERTGGRVKPVLVPKPRAWSPRPCCVCRAWARAPTAAAAAQSVAGLCPGFSVTTWELRPWEGFVCSPGGEILPPPTCFLLSFQEHSESPWNRPFRPRCKLFKACLFISSRSWNFSDTELLLWHIIMIGCLHHIIAWYIMSGKSLFPLLFEYWTSEIN